MELIKISFSLFIYRTKSQNCIARDIQVNEVYCMENSYAHKKMRNVHMSQKCYFYCKRNIKWHCAPLGILQKSKVEKSRSSCVIWSYVISSGQRKSRKWNETLWTCTDHFCYKGKQTLQWKTSGVNKWKSLSHVQPFAIPWKILEWIALPFSMGYFQPRDWTQVSRIAGRFFTSWATREVNNHL